MTGARIEVEGLRVLAGNQVLVDDVGFTVEPGQVLALIGESGSGKTTIALSLLGYARTGCTIAAGRVQVGETDVLALPEPARRALRGRRVAYVAQSAAAAFNPARRLLDQVTESARLHGVLDRTSAKRKALALFEELALEDPERIARSWPHEVSGGQLQRVMAAMALMAEPEVVVFDEPTTALDVTTQIEVLAVFRRVLRERAISAVYVSHDLAVVAQMADQVIVLRHGRVLESAATAQLLASPQHDYTRRLLAASRQTEDAPPVSDIRGQVQEPLLHVRGLSAGYGPMRTAALALEDINLRVWPGQALGVVGESGSGKSTLARVIAGLIAPSSGSLHFGGRELAGTVKQRDRETLRRIQIVFQHADTALNPAHTIGAILARPLALFHRLDQAACRRRVAELLDLVQLPSTLAGRSPASLSGGQKQRVNLARALAAEPDLVLCDEVTSALDPVVAAAIVDLIAELRRTLNVSWLFISHDLDRVRALCERIVVMRYGRKLAEVGAGEAMEGQHPYYVQLARSVPELRTDWLDGVLSGRGGAK